jgi:uncharacterized surface protein with fasciclin (FAS1) repeats
MSNIVQSADKAGTFKTLLAAVTAAGLTPVLEGKGPYTVFAPNDAAFAKLPKGTVEALLADIPKLKKTLNYHVVSGDVRTVALAKMNDVKTVEGGQIRIHTNGGVKVNDSNVIGTEVVSDNGVIHVIDTVLIPSN